MHQIPLNNETMGFNQEVYLDILKQREAILKAEEEKKRAQEIKERTGGKANVQGMMKERRKCSGVFPTQGLLGIDRYVMAEKVKRQSKQK